MWISAAQDVYSSSKFHAKTMHDIVLFLHTDAAAQYNFYTCAFL